MNQIINMIMRMVMRQVVSRGVNKGFDMASKGMAARRKPAASAPPPVAPPAAPHQAQRPGGVSAEDEAEMAAKAQAQGGASNPWDKNGTKRLKQQMKISRRVGRF
ncbi:MAG: hypothetical protein AAF092_03915 [Pseudomonadota bacterium]